jgi:prephenate dehydratase
MARKKKIRVAIQGIVTSFHEIAAITYFDEPLIPLECLTFHQLCTCLDKEEADYAVMAIENSIAGSILPNYFLLQQYRFRIIGEVYLPIHLHLLALPGVRLEDIRTIESHPMAIRQCSDFLHALGGVEIRESDDTALSAQHIRTHDLRSTAAIANERAAERFRLDILRKRIETHQKNFTRFLILSKNGSSPKKSNKASLWFEIPNTVGSLADTLVILKNHRLNLSRIQSIPILGRPDEYSMHVDVEWRLRANYDDAMRQVTQQVHNLNVLGEYMKGKMRS